MLENAMETNRVELSGMIITEPEFSHKSYGESFFQFALAVERKSGYRDEIQVIVSDRLMAMEHFYVGGRVCVLGQIRTYNEFVNGKNKLSVVVFAREVTDECDCMGDENIVELEGYICKEPIKRVSPLGREICDVMLAVNRMYNKSDYIPCIAWGRNAVYAGGLSVGSRLAITGRMQSREYRKKDAEGNVEIKVAYEVSILKIEE